MDPGWSLTATLYPNPQNHVHFNVGWKVKKLIQVFLSQMQCQGKNGSWRKRNSRTCGCIYDMLLAAPPHSSGPLKHPPRQGLALPVPRRRQRHTASTGSLSPHGCECAFGAGRSTAAATFGQCLFRFSSHYFPQNTTAVKTHIISANYYSIFPPENRCNPTVRSPFWPYLEIKHKIAKDCVSSLPSLSFPLPWNWDDV